MILLTYVIRLGGVQNLGKPAYVILECSLTVCVLLLLMSPSASPDASHDASPTKKSLDSSQIVKITKKWRLWMKKEDENLKIDKFEHKEDS